MDLLSWEMELICLDLKPVKDLEIDMDSGDIADSFKLTARNFVSSVDCVSDTLQVLESIW